VSSARPQLGWTLDYRMHLLSLYETLPFENHPLWEAILNGKLSLQQVLKAEIQHYIRTKAGQSLRGEALERARGFSPKLFEALLATYLEECTSEKSGASHLDLIKKLLLHGGVPEEELDSAKPTPGNSAAIALYRDISARGAACHMLGAGVVEFYYSKISPQIFDAYTLRYGMTKDQAETYALHGSMDQVHAERALSILDDAVKFHGWTTIEQSVRDALVATSLHYDGMLQAATGNINYWNGE